MGFLGFLFSGEKQVKSLREGVLNDLNLIKQEIQRSHEQMKKENEDVLSVLASFEGEIEQLKQDIGNGGKNEKSASLVEKRLSSLEKVAATVKAIGRLSIQNHDSIKSMESAVNKLDALEKALKQHISLTPEIVISKDEYSEEINELKNRLDALESRELIVLRESKKKQKRP